MLHLHLKAWLVYSSVKATLPAQLYADPRGDFRDMPETPHILNYTGSISHLYQFSTQKKI